MSTIKLNTEAEVYALKIFKNGERVITITTRTGLIINEVTLEIESDVSAYAGMEYVLFDITNQVELRRGVIDTTELPAPAELEQNGSFRF